MKFHYSAMIVLLMSGVATAADAPGGMPVLPKDATWAGVMLNVVAGLFFAAAVIGPIASQLMPGVQEPESHDEHELDDNHGH